MIDQKREEISEKQGPDDSDKGDFLTILLTDDVFKDKDVMIVDECLTFLVAATLTTTLMI